MKRYIVDDLYSIVMKRFFNENPDIEFNNAQMDAIWFSLKGVLDREGKEKAFEYAKTVKLNDFSKEEIKRGYS
jgi:hypothetical protein